MLRLLFPSCLDAFADVHRVYTHSPFRSALAGHSLNLWPLSPPVGWAVAEYEAGTALPLFYIRSVVAAM